MCVLPFDPQVAYFVASVSVLIRVLLSLRHVLSKVLELFVSCLASFDGCSLLRCLKWFLCLESMFQTQRFFSSAVGDVPKLNAHVS